MELLRNELGLDGLPLPLPLPGEPPRVKLLPLREGLSGLESPPLRRLRVLDKKLPILPLGGDPWDEGEDALASCTSRAAAISASFLSCSSCICN